MTTLQTEWRHHFFTNLAKLMAPSLVLQKLVKKRFLKILHNIFLFWPFFSFIFLLRSNFIKYKKLNLKWSFFRKRLYLRGHTFRIYSKISPFKGNDLILSFNKTYSRRKTSIPFLGNYCLNKEEPQFLLLRLALLIPLEFQF